MYRRIIRIGIIENFRVCTRHFLSSFDNTQISRVNHKQFLFAFVEQIRNRTSFGKPLNRHTCEMFSCPIGIFILLNVIFDQRTIRIGTGESIIAERHCCTLKCLLWQLSERFVGRVKINRHVTETIGCCEVFRRDFETKCRG